MIKKTQVALYFILQISEKINKRYTKIYMNHVLSFCKRKQFKLFDNP